MDEPRFLEWETIDGKSLDLCRASVPGGWLVCTIGLAQGLTSVTFFPDPKHEWKVRLKTGLSGRFRGGEWKP